MLITRVGVFCLASCFNCLISWSVHCFPLFLLDFDILTTVLVRQAKFSGAHGAPWLDLSIAVVDIKTSFKGVPPLTLSRTILPFP